MKKFYCLTLLLFTALSQAQIVTIPDANFKNALIELGIDTNGDGEIQVSEAEAIGALNVSHKNISSLEGIQSFTNLSSLFCNNNQLSHLDISQNTNLEILDCFVNELSDLDVSQNTNLEHLKCTANQLSNLDVSQNTNLRLLDFAFNQLSSIDVSQNTNLEVLSCRNNQLNSLDVSQNTNLQVLLLAVNQLSSLDVSQNTNLEILICRNNQLSSLNIKNNNNHNMIKMIARENPALTCIQVDDETATYPTCDIPNDDGWCKDPQSMYSEECILGVEDFDPITLTLYPNPTQDILNIESQEVLESIRIYSINGNLVKENLNTTVSVSELSNGLYFVQVSIEGKTITKKFIKS